MEAVSQVCTNCFYLCTRKEVIEEEEEKKKERPWNLSAFPSALEVRRIQCASSDVTELSRFRHQEVQCFWVSLVHLCGMPGRGGGVYTPAKLHVLKDVSHPAVSVRAEVNNVFSQLGHL